MKKTIKFKTSTIQFKNLIRNKNGFTIMELLVAISIGLFLLGAMSKIFFDSKSTIRSQTNSAKMFDDANVSLFSMQNEIASAGFRGCNSGLVAKATKENFFSSAGTANYFNKSVFMEGSQGTGSGFNPAINAAISSLSPSPNNKMDVLTIRTANTEPSVTTTDQSSPANPLAVSSVNVKANDLAIITNCSSSSLFRVASVSGSTQVTPAGALSTTFPIGSQLYKYSTITYYVGSDNVLYKVVNNENPSPIADNVEKFSVLYGINTDNKGDSVNKYVFASSVGDFTKVLSVRIGLVLKSNDINTLGTSKSTYSYKFNGITTTPNDGKMRKVFYTTVTLRNMVP